MAPAEVTVKELPIEFKVEVLNEQGEVIRRPQVEKIDISSDAPGAIVKPGGTIKPGEIAEALKDASKETFKIKIKNDPGKIRNWVTGQFDNGMGLSPSDEQTLSNLENWLFGFGSGVMDGLNGFSDIPDPPLPFYEGDSVVENIQNFLGFSEAIQEWKGYGAGIQAGQQLAQANTNIREALGELREAIEQWIEELPPPPKFEWPVIELPKIELPSWDWPAWPVEPAPSPVPAPETPSLPSEAGPFAGPIPSPPPQEGPTDSKILQEFEPGSGWCVLAVNWWISTNYFYADTDFQISTGKPYQWDYKSSIQHAGGYFYSKYSYGKYYVWYKDLRQIKQITEPGRVIWEIHFDKNLAYYDGRSPDFPRIEDYRKETDSPGRTVISIPTFNWLGYGYHVSPGINSLALHEFMPNHIGAMVDFEGKLIPSYYPEYSFFHSATPDSKDYAFQFPAGSPVYWLNDRAPNGARSYYTQAANYSFSKIRCVSSGRPELPPPLPEQPEDKMSCCDCESIRLMIRSMQMPVKVPVVSCEQKEETVDGKAVTVWRPKIESKEITLPGVSKESVLGIAKVHELLAEAAIRDCNAKNENSALGKIKLNVVKVSCTQNQQNLWEPATEEIEVTVIGDEETATAEVLRFQVLADLAAAECRSRNPEPAIAVVPEWWQVRVGVNRPQLVVLFAEIDRTGKVGRGRWPITIPHYRYSSEVPLNLPGYKKGQWEAILTLADNSKVIINAVSRQEANKMIGAIKQLIKPELLTESHLKVGERKGQNLLSIDVVPVWASFFSTGQKDTNPDWTKNLRK